MPPAERFPLVEQLGVPVLSHQPYYLGGCGDVDQFVRAVDLERVLAPLAEIAKLIEVENQKLRRRNGPWRNPYHSHAHDKSGIWDGDNGDLAGKRCAACALFEFVEKHFAPPPDTHESLLREMLDTGVIVGSSMRDRARALLDGQGRE